MIEAAIIKKIEKQLKLLPGMITCSLNSAGNIEALKVPAWGIRENELNAIISQLAQLSELTDLDLSGNPGINIEPISKIRQLKVLDLNNNRITDISALSNLTNLEKLFLSRNRITDIAPLSNLKRLKTLYLWGNEIQDISPLESLVRLDSLLLQNNPIRELPNWITSFGLEIVWGGGGDSGKIYFDKNPITIPPIEVLQLGNEAIENYFAQIKKENGKTDFLFEAKLLVLGEGGTGKTTFTRKIQDANAEMPHERSTTLGIHVGKWNYLAEFPIPNGPNRVRFNINLWDFGGQQIYQGTHQIFFADKSFYVLVSDTRAETTDFAYWLNTVEQLAGSDSSLLIVHNKKFGHVQKFDETGFRSRFGKLIKDVVQLDLQNDKSQILSLQDKVKSYIKQLPGIGDPLPPSWVAIREDLIKEKRKFISFERFRNTCKKYGIKEISTIGTVSRYFNRIGAFTHYIDDDILREVIFLNSNWLVKTVYEVLDNETAKSKKGRLNIAEINIMWSHGGLEYEVSKLTRLMHNFGLMYHISGTDSYVIPAHLPTIKPYTEWPWDKSENILKFIYEFDKYMPRGIMSRLIVALHHHIKNHDLVWHRGVNIESDNSHAEIIESYGGTNSFEIRIAGSNRIALLAIIRERFAEILKPFNNLRYKQLVPCVCEECRKSDNPAFHEYSKLLKFKGQGKGSQCDLTGEQISVEELLKITESGIKQKSRSVNFFNEKKTIKLFLASSSELKEDRNEFEIFIQRENERLNNEGIFIKLQRWENFIDAMSKTSLQEEYNSAVRHSEIFLSLFFTKVGKYTAQEFETAFGQFKQTGKPKVYTYFKDAPVDMQKIRRADINSKFEFEEKLEELGHFKTTYKNMDDLKYQFKMQLDEILPLL